MLVADTKERECAAGMGEVERVLEKEESKVHSKVQRTFQVMEGRREDESLQVICFRAVETRRKSGKESGNHLSPSRNVH